METPSSTRRVTRSQTSAGAQMSKQEEPLSRSRAKGTAAERSALLDITNDSPIVGLATERTPVSSAADAKSRGRPRRTPGSGEALLRGQVKTLLQKVEEEEAAAGDIGGRIPSGRPPYLAILGFLKSPSQLLAPTPANTPQVPNLAGIKEEDVPMGVVVTCVAQELDRKIPIQVEVLKQDEALDPLDCQISRALMFDSPGKSDSSTVSSSLTYQESESCRTGDKSSEDDNSSAWSIQVNAGTPEDDEENKEDLEEGEELYFNGEEEEEEEEEGVEGCFDDLCEGMRRMRVEEEEEEEEKGLLLPKFAGKHTRFIYNSDDEMEGEEEVGASVSPSVLVLKGLPAPEGKHLRFQDEEEEEED